MATRSTNHAHTRKDGPVAETATAKRGAGTRAKPQTAASRAPAAVVAAKLSSSLEKARANLREGDVFLDRARKILG